MPKVTIDGIDYDLHDTGPRGWGHVGNDWADAITTKANNSTAISTNASETVSATGNAKLQVVNDRLRVSIGGEAFTTIAFKNAKIFNALDYGLSVTNSGSANLTALQNCINDAKAASATANVKVYIPRGVNSSGVTTPYDIGGTAVVSGCRNFEIYGDGPGATRLRWSGTSIDRWVTGTAYTVGQQVNSLGLIFQCATSGTSGSTTATQGANGPYTRTNGIADGTCVWNYVSVDTQSDLFRISDSQYVWLHDLELEGPAAATSTKTARPRALLNLHQPAGYAYTNGSHTVSRVGFNVSSDPGLPMANTTGSAANDHWETDARADYGILLDYDTNDYNNSENTFEHCGIVGCYVGYYSYGNSAQDNLLRKLNMGPSLYTCVGTFNGSFSASHCNMSAMAYKGYVFDLGAPNDRIKVDSCISESTGRWFRTSTGAYGGAPWPITFDSCRFSCDKCAPDGIIGLHTFRGPLRITGNVLDGGHQGTGSFLATSLPKFSLSSSLANAGNSIVEGNAFQYSNTSVGAAYLASAVATSPSPVNVVERRNTYYNGATSVHRLEAGQVTFTSAGTAQSVTFGVPTCSSGYVVTYGVSSRTGASAAAKYVSTITSKTTTGFTINLDSAPTGTDSVVVDWAIHWQ